MEGSRWAERALGYAAQLDARLVGRLHVALYFMFATGAMQAHVRAPPASRRDRPHRPVGCGHHEAQVFDKAVASGREAVGMAHAGRDRSTLAAALANFAAYALAVDDVDGAHAAAREALDLVRDLGKTLMAMRAARLMGAPTGLYRAFGIERNDRTRLVRCNRCRNTLQTAIAAGLGDK